MAGAQGEAEKQGYLGNLEKRSRSELQDLLTRQEKLLDNKQFISRLPDKGKRIRDLAEKLHSILALHSEVDGTADMFEKMAIDADYKHRSRASVKNIPDEETEGTDILKEIVNKDSVEKVVEDNRDEGTMETGNRTFINSYDRVIRKVETRQVQGEEINKKFKPYRTIQAQHICDVPEEKLKQLKQSGHSQSVNSVENSVDSQSIECQMDASNRTDVGTHVDTKSSENTVSLKIENANRTVDEVSKASGKPDVKPSSSSNTSRLKHRYDDSLEMDMSKGPLQHAPAKLITVGESIKVLEEQQKLHKKLQAQQAADRLAQRLHIKVGNFSPEGAPAASTVYREPVETSDAEHGDSDLDYPD